MRERLIGIDAGGTMTKAALFDLEGRELGCERRANVMTFPAPGQTERDPDAMWNAACAAIRDLLTSTGTAPDDVAAVSASGYGSGLYVVDRHGDPVRPGIGSTDTRSLSLIAEWQSQGLADACAARLNQRLWPGQSLALLGWLTRHEPGLLDRAHAILFCKDFLRGRLSGTISTDPTDAGISGLLDITTGTYAEDVLDMLGLSGWADRMPLIHPGCSVQGGVTDAAARLTGLRAGTPVVQGLLDVAASSLASGVTNEGQLSVVAGTFSINSTVHRRPRTSTLPFLQCAFPAGDSYLATEGAATSASNFEWFCKQLLTAEGLGGTGSGHAVYDLCNGLVHAAMAGSNGILFFPFLFGGPGGAPAGLLGMRADHALGDVLRGIYEGIAFAHRWDIDVLLSGADAAKPSVARLAGGASRSPIWGQIFADTLALPVETMEGSEMGAKGVAIASAVAIGAYPDVKTAVAAMARTAKRVEPSPVRVEELARKYERYAAVHRALVPSWADGPALQATG